MKETLRHREAFEHYYALGEKRSLASLASHSGVTLRSINRWNTAFGWQDRVLARDRELADAIEKKSKAATLATKIEYRKLIQASLAPMVKQIKQGAGCASIADMERMIKLDLLLMGEPTEHIKGQVAADDLFDRIEKYADVFARRDGKGPTDSDGAGEPLDTD